MTVTIVPAACSSPPAAAAMPETEQAEMIPSRLRQDGDQAAFGRKRKFLRSCMELSFENNDKNFSTASLGGLLRSCMELSFENNDKIDQVGRAPSCRRSCRRGSSSSS